MIKKCERRRQRRTTEHVYTISSLCESNGSGELKRKVYFLTPSMNVHDLRFQTPGRGFHDKCLKFMFMVTQLSKDKTSVTIFFQYISTMYCKSYVDVSEEVPLFLTFVHIICKTYKLKTIVKIIPTTRVSE